MKRILIILTFIGMGFSLFGQSIVNNGARIVINEGTNLKVTDINNSEKNGYLYFNSNIDLQGDWINNHPAVFESGDKGVVILNGDSKQVLKSSNSNFNVLVVQNSSAAGIILNDDLLISGHLFLDNGVIKTGDYKVEFMENALSEPGNSHSFIYGNLERTGKGEFIFPTGDIINDNEFIWAPVIVIPEQYAVTEARYYYDILNENVYNAKPEQGLEGIIDNKYYILKSDQNFDAGIYSEIFDQENYAVAFLDENVWNNISNTADYKKNLSYKKDFIMGYNISKSDMSIISIGIKNKETYNNNEGEYMTSKPYVTVYPNPFNDEINIVSSNLPSKDSEIFIFNSLGSILHNQKIMTPQSENSQNINLSEFAPGMYYIKMISGDYVNHIKIEKF